MMRIRKKITMGGQWAKVGEDILDGSLITIEDSGKETDGEFGTRYVFKVKTPKGERIMSFNNTSLNNLVDAFGEDTDAWVGQMVKAFVVKAMVSGKMRNVVYLAGIDWDMLDDGSFARRTKQSNTYINPEGVGINYEV